MTDYLKKRTNYLRFKDEIPPMEIIIKILDEATKITPVKNDVYNFKCRVYGPEWADAKWELYTHSYCMSYRVKNESEEVEKDYEELVKSHKKFPDPDIERYAKNQTKRSIKQEILKVGYSDSDGYTTGGNARSITGAEISKGQVISSPKTVENSIEFNEQLLAPYLLAPYVTSEYSYKTIKSEQHGNNFGERPVIGLSMWAYCVAVVAEKYGLNSGFCGCFAVPDYPIKIFDDIIDREDSLLDSKWGMNRLKEFNNDLPFFIGLGYGDTHQATVGRRKPPLSSIVSFA